MEIFLNILLSVVKARFNQSCRFELRLLCTIHPAVMSQFFNNAARQYEL